MSCVHYPKKKKKKIIIQNIYIYIYIRVVLLFRGFFVGYNIHTLVISSLLSSISSYRT